MAPSTSSTTDGHAGESESVHYLPGKRNGATGDGYFDPPTTGVPACSLEELQKLYETLTLQHAASQRERDDLARQLAGIPRSAIDAEKSLLAIRQARDTLLARNHELMGQLTHTEDQLAELGNASDDLVRAQSATAEELSSLRKECDDLRRKALDLTEQKSALLEAERTQTAVLTDASRQIAGLTEERDDALTRAATLEARNIAAGDTAELQTALATAKRQVEQLIADREALRTQFVSEQTALLAQIAALHAKAGLVGSDTEADAESAKPLARKDASLAALQKRLTTLRDDPQNLESLDIVHDQFQNLAKRGLSDGNLATGKLATTGAELARALRKQPKKIAASLDSFDEALALITRLGALKDKAQLPDPSGALVYSVDGDLDNCECVAMALEKFALRTKYAVKPEAALADLAAGPCDLVVLDVDLPGMDGFALHARIREIPHHAATPIIFLSGMMSAAARVGKMPAAKNRFVAKPYNLNDLSLKALSMIVESRLAS